MGQLLVGVSKPDYAPRFLPDPKATMVFVGYQLRVVSVRGGLRYAMPILPYRGAREPSGPRTNQLIGFGCGSFFMPGLDGSKNDHLTSLSRGRRGGSGLDTTLSV